MILLKIFIENVLLLWDERAMLLLVISWLGVVLADSVAVPAGSIPSGQGVASSSLASTSSQWSGQSGGGLLSFAPFLLMFGVLYFLILRPQQKKMKEQQTLLNNLKQGDSIVTAAGIFGKIVKITDKVVTLEISENVRVKLMKSQIAQVLDKEIT